MHIMPVIYQGLWLFGEIFWIWMLVDCILNEPDKFLWIWIILFANVVGAIIYFIMRRPVSLNVSELPFFGRFTRAGEINEAESNAYNMPNAYNYSKLGDIYMEIGNIDKAGKAYAKSLEYDADMRGSLWGAARIDLKNKDFKAAELKLTKVVKTEPDYKYGEAALAYARALFETKDFKAAKKQLEAYVAKYTHPEAKLLLAQILSGEGSKEAAKKLLEEALMDLKGTPNFYYSKNRKWVGRIKAELNKIKQDEFANSAGK